MARKSVTLGFRAHSGWAAMVAVAGPAKSPAVLSRKRIVTADPKFRGSKQPYHFVEELSLSEAAPIVARCWKSSVELAGEAIEAEVRALGAKGFEVAICAVLAGRRTEMPELEKILASHPMLHTAEGIMFRQVLLMAGEACGLRVAAIAERGIEDRVAKELGVERTQVMPRLTELGRGLGAPWTLDQKYASAAAWLALHSRI